MKSIAFLGAKSVGFACLKILEGLQKEGGFSIDAVFTNMSRNAEINKNMVDYAIGKGMNVYEEIDEILNLEKFDYIVSVQYHKILKKQHIDCAKELAINLHMAPLPDFRGCNQFSYAIINNATEFGTTLHVINERIDDGDILAELRFPIPDGCFVTELYDITLKKSIELFEQNIMKIFNGECKRVPQSDLVEERGTMLGYRSDINKLKHIDLSWDKAKIEAHIRAVSMPGFEPPYFMIGDKKFYIESKDVKND